MVPEPVIEALGRARARGFLGPGLVVDQIEHSLDLLGAAERAVASELAGSFLDLGSGGGLPGLVFASERGALHGVLLDAQTRRCAFLADAIGRVGLDDRLQVFCGRAETLSREPELRGKFDLVVARGFGRPAVTAECAAGFLRAGGHLLVSEPPPGADPAGRWDEEGLATLGYRSPRFARVGAATVASLELHSTSADWPRRSGVPAKRPVW